MHWVVLVRITWIFPVPSVCIAGVVCHSCFPPGPGWLRAPQLALLMAIHHHPHTRTVFQHDSSQAQSSSQNYPISAHHRVKHICSPGISFPSRVVLHKGENCPPSHWRGGGEWMAVWGCFAGLTHKTGFFEKILEELPFSMFKIIV